MQSQSVTKVNESLAQHLACRVLLNKVNPIPTLVVLGGGREGERNRVVSSLAANEWPPSNRSISVAAWRACLRAKSGQAMVPAVGGPDTTLAQQPRGLP